MMKRFFDIGSPLMRNLIRIFDCMCLSVIWIVFSIPIITMGASSAAMYTTVVKYIRKDEGYLWRSFWDAFKENLKRSTLAWLVAMVVMTLLIVDALVFRSMVIKGEFLGNLYWFILVLICVAVTWIAYLSAYSARFNGSVKDVLRFSFVLMTYHPIKSLCVFLPILVSAALILIMPGLLVATPAVTCWIYSITTEKVFLLHMRPEDLERETGADADS